MDKLKTVKQYTREVLEEDPRTRDNTKWLVLQVLRKMGYRIYINYDDFREMPSFGSITRSARDLQGKNSNKLQASEQSQFVRNLQESKYKAVFSGERV